MAKVQCLRHPHYNGIEPPDLSCKVCCAKYVALIKLSQDVLKKQQGLGAYRSQKKNSEQAADQNVAPAIKFHPGTI